MNTPPPPDGVGFDDMLKQGLSHVLMRADSELLVTYHLAGTSLQWKPTSTIDDSTNLSGNTTSAR